MTSKTKLNHMSRIEDVLQGDNEGENEQRFGRVLRETSSRLNRPLEMSSLLQKLPDDERVELDVAQAGGGEDGATEDVTFGFQTPSKRRGRQSLLQLALSSSAKKRQQQEQLLSPSRPHLPPLQEERDEESSPSGSVPEGTPERRSSSRARRALLSPSTPRPARGTLLTPKCIPAAAKKSPRTPSSRRSLAPQLADASTPTSFRRALRTRIKEVVYDTDFESDSDISIDSEEEEFKPEGVSCSSSCDSSDEGTSGSEVSPPVPVKKAEKAKTPVLNKRRKRLDPEETASGDSYFMQNEGKASSRTSDRTLSELTVPRLSLAALRKVVGTEGFDTHHQQHRQALLEQHCSLFEKWTTLLEHGYSVCVHGVGSKKPLLTLYQQQHLADCDHIVVNGFFPSLTLRSIVSCILEEVLCLDTRPPALCDQLQLLQEIYSRPSAAPLTLVVHNLDGPMLRSSATQLPLSRLCSLPSVRLLASVDHINAPLVLDSRTAADYNFVWFDCTTLAPYVEETSYENSLLVQQSSTLALSSLLHVFRSLTPCAKGIFLLLVERQLESQHDPSYQGMSFGELYQQSRERLLVTSELTLRTQLTEFRDHKLLRQRRDHDGAEVLSVPLASGPLKEFFDQQQQQD